MHVARMKYSWPFLLLCGSVALAAEPAPPGPLYIQGSEVNLRAAPSKSADIVAKARIATECAEVAPKPKEREWVKLKCGEQEGYTLRGLVGAERPDFDSLLAKAANSRASAQARYDAGMRAVSLMPDSRPAARALRAAFFDLQFQELMQMPEYERAWLSAPASAEILTQSDEVAPGDRKSTPELGFHNAGFDWEDIQARGRRFVYIISRLGRLHVVFGHVEVVGPPIGALAHPMAYKEFELGETLARALSWNGRPNPFGEAGNGPLWSASAEEINMVGSLPRSWTRLRGEPGHRELLSVDSDGQGCVDQSMRIVLDFDFQKFQDREELISVQRDRNRYAIRSRSEKGEEAVVTVEWPVDEGDVGLLNGVPYAPGHLKAHFPWSCERVKASGKSRPH